MQDAIFKLLAETKLNLFFAKGEGLGAFLLALVIIVFLLSKPYYTSKLADLFRSWRGD